MQEAKGGAFVIGLDVAKLKVDACLRLPSGKLRSKVVANSYAGYDDLLAWLTKHGAHQGHACMEATGPYWEALAERLADAGYAVSVVNPAQVKAYGSALGVRSKTDAADAKLLAEFCAAQTPAVWQAAAPAVRQLRALVARREALLDLRTQESNRLQVAHQSIKASIEAVLQHLDEQIRAIEQQIRQHIDDDPTLKSQRGLRVGPASNIKAWQRSPSQGAVHASDGQHATDTLGQGVCRQADCSREAEDARARCTHAQAGRNCLRRLEIRQTLRSSTPSGLTATTVSARPEGRSVRSGGPSMRQGPQDRSPPALHKSAPPSTACREG